VTADSAIGVIGGSGFYSLLDEPEQRVVDTPYGAPSDAVTLGTLAGRNVAFVPRHGADHRFPPHLVPYRANLWALRSLGVRQVVALSAVGSLTTSLPTGTLVVPDQVVDRTSGRAHTYFDAPTGVGHATFADPYCARGRSAAHAAGGAHEGGTLVVINGPRFSSRAESLEFQSHGWSIIGMTGMPETALARELALCYTSLTLVTDLDAGVEAGEGVTHAEVLATFAANLPKLRELLVGTLSSLPSAQADCPCGTGDLHVAG
jgi:5'-methylthioadenosine phosphorylase